MSTRRLAGLLQLSRRDYSSAQREQRDSIHLPISRARLYFSYHNANATWPDILTAISTVLPSAPGIGV